MFIDKLLVNKASHRVLYFLSTTYFKPNTVLRGVKFHLLKWMKIDTATSLQYFQPIMLSRRNEFRLILFVRNYLNGVSIEHLKRFDWKLRNGGNRSDVTRNLKYKKTIELPGTHCRLATWISNVIRNTCFSSRFTGRALTNLAKSEN